MNRQRLCWIDTASIENEQGQGDGAYDLIDVCGTPEEIGKALADSLKEADLFGGRLMESHIEEGQDLYLNLRIKFCEPEAKGESFGSWKEDDDVSPNVVQEGGCS